MRASTSWRVLAFSRFCCSTMAATSCSGVSRKDHTSGASALSHAQISAMVPSSMHPGPVRYHSKNKRKNCGGVRWTVGGACSANLKASWPPTREPMPHTCPPLQE